MTDKKKPVIVTYALDGPDGPYAGMIDDWRPRHEAYCAKYGYDFVAYKTPEEGGIVGRSPYWSKVDVILRHLRDERYSHVFWLDCDTIIADFDVDMRTSLPSWAWIGMTVHPYAMGEDVWHWQSGTIYVRSCPESIAFFERVLEFEGKSDSTGYQYGSEQHAMHALFNAEGYEWQRGLVALPFPWNNTLHDQPVSPIVAAFHGNGNAQERRQIMRNWAHNYFRGDQGFSVSLTPGELQALQQQTQSMTLPKVQWGPVSNQAQPGEHRI